MSIIIEMLDICFEKRNETFNNKNNVAIQINYLNYLRLKINN
jgi:hypothetical protein